MRAIFHLPILRRDRAALLGLVYGTDETLVREAPEPVMVPCPCCGGDGGFGPEREDDTAWQQCVCCDGTGFVPAEPAERDDDFDAECQCGRCPDCTAAIADSVDWPPCDEHEDDPGMRYDKPMGDE